MNDSQKLKIAFLTALDPKDRRSYSGSYYYMSQALIRNATFDVKFITLINPVEKSIRSRIHKITEASSLKKKMRFLFTFYNAVRYARTARQKMKGYEFDFIIAPAAAREIAFLKTSVPIVYINDATWGLLLNYYANHSNMAAIAVFQGQIIEKKAMQKSALLSYSSQWAANSAVNTYGVSSTRVSVIPWGANLDEVPDRETVLSKPSLTECRLLFIGRQWVRKRGQIAFDTLLALERLGIQAQLVICGCIPPEGITHPRMTVIQNLDKNDIQQRKQLEELFLNAGFFLLPTKAECTASVVCEAAAFGLPVITTDTGGLASIVDDGITGRLLPVEAGGEQYAEIIKELYSNESKYKSMVLASRKKFENCLNWNTWASSLAEKLKAYHILHDSKN